jgi:hypothetical protein
MIHGGDLGLIHRIRFRGDCAMIGMDGNGGVEMCAAIEMTGPCIPRFRPNSVKYPGSKSWLVNALLFQEEYALLPQQVLHFLSEDWFGVVIDYVPCLGVSRHKRFCLLVMGSARHLTRIASASDRLVLFVSLTTSSSMSFTMRR